MVSSQLRKFAERQDWVREQQRQLFPLSEVTLGLYQRCLQKIESVTLKDLETSGPYELTVDQIRFTVTHIAQGGKTYWSVGTEMKGDDGRFHDCKSLNNIVISLPKSVDDEIRKIMKAMLDDLTSSTVKRLLGRQQMKQGKIGVT